MANERPCPQPNCRELLTYVKKDPENIGGGGDRISLPLDSDIYRCPKHGLMRIYVSGTVKPYVERNA